MKQPRKAFLLYEPEMWDKTQIYVPGEPENSTMDADTMRDRMRGTASFEEGGVDFFLDAQPGDAAPARDLGFVLCVRWWGAFR